ncbi:1-phosphofructokinase family hexose kinase [Pseudoruegeria sp. SHC-113]|uniref:1-phosphofructokinase family hexose kinase n=1 Tax=Pseudoruegeria sp. SHC-113 TaxID=2855439 RepID=UPI0021BA5D5A|nr:1-phosphofructokinase family hexose kinase [Pseudoruegeria sp. SHC-113]MCT8161899.1 1-phosphofructokinase family hexose kinase [Pseudoruegeria sp. SHC-113]
MPDILTLTLNPALDIATHAPQVVPGPKLRCAAPQVDPGGGGINVSRAIRNIGGQSRALVAAGGATGAALMDLLRKEGIDAVALPAPGDTRQSLSVTDESTGKQFRFVMPGPTWSPSEIARFLQDALALAPEGGLVVLSGSQPPGLPDDFPRTLNAALGERKARLILDTSGAPLQAIAEGGPTPVAVLRMDQEEAEALAGRVLPTAKAAGAFAQELCARGAAETVILARGAEGAVIAQADGTAMACGNAQVPVASKVGAGDSFVGGFTLALSRGLSAIEAVRHGNAAASAAVMTPATDLCRAEDVAACLPQCTLRAL